MSALVHTQYRDDIMGYVETIQRKQEADYSHLSCFLILTLRTVNKP